MKTVFSALLCAVLFLSGCESVNYQAGVTVDPTTGNTTVGGNISGTFKDRSLSPALAIEPNRSYGRIYDSVRVFNESRGLNECEAPVRSIDPCGTTRSVELGSVNLRTIDVVAASRSIQLARDTVRQTAKYDLKDLKERLSRENHNGKVLQDATINRSMWSVFMGFFGHHRKPQPLPAAETVTLASILPGPDPSALSGTTSPQTASGSVSGLPPSGIMKGDTLEQRVTNLETDMKAIREWVNRHP